MLRLTAKSRRESIEGSNNQKYFLYAIGEILLVVIGILLALQINNWNEDRKDNLKARQYLLSLQQEFHTNLDEITIEIEFRKAVKGRIVELIHHTGPGIPGIPMRDFSALFRRTAFQNSFFEPAVGVLQDMINSGNLNIIRDQALRSHLSGWNSRLQFVRDMESINEGYREMIKELLFKKGNALNLYGGLNQRSDLGESSHFKTDPRILLQIEEFQSILVAKEAATTNLITRYETTRDAIQTILDLIEESMK